MANNALRPVICEASGQRLLAVGRLSPEPNSDDKNQRDRHAAIRLTAIQPRFSCRRPDENAVIATVPKTIKSCAAWVLARSSGAISLGQQRGAADKHEVPPSPSTIKPAEKFEKSMPDKAMPIAQRLAIRARRDDIDHAKSLDDVAGEEARAEHADDVPLDDGRRIELKSKPQNVHRRCGVEVISMFITPYPRLPDETTATIIDRLYAMICSDRAACRRRVIRLRQANGMRVNCQNVIADVTLSPMQSTAKLAENVTGDRSAVHTSRVGAHRNAANNTACQHVRDRTGAEILGRHESAAANR